MIMTQLKKRVLKMNELEEIIRFLDNELKKEDALVTKHTIKRNLLWNLKNHIERGEYKNRRLEENKKEEIENG